MNGANEEKILLKMQLLRDLSFRNKLIVYAMGVSLISLFVACFAFVLHDYSSFRDSLLERTVVEANVVGRTSSSALVFFDKEFAAEVLGGLAAQPHVEAACIYDSRGATFAQYDCRKHIRKCPAPSAESSHRFDAGSLEVFQVVVFEGDKVGTIYIRTNLDALHARLISKCLIVSLVMLVSFFIAVLVSGPARKFIIKPVMDLVRTANDISENKDYSTRAEISGDDEHGILTRAFNDMIEQIEAGNSALIEREEMLDAIFNAITDMVALTTSDGIILATNIEGARRTDKSPEELSGTCIYDLFPSKSADLLRQKFRNVVSTGKPVFFVDETEGKVYENSIYPIFDDAKKVVKLTTYARDITDTKKAELAFIETRDRLSRIADNTPDIIIRWSPEHGLDYVNSSIERLLGYKSDEVQGDWGFFINIAHPDDRMIITNAFVGMPDSEPDRRIIEFRALSLDGDVVWLEAILVPIMKDGKLIAVEAIARDVTHRKEAEEEKETLWRQLQHSQKMEAIGQLAGGMAHDFNNMLAIIMMSSEMALMHLDVKEDVKLYVDRILKAANRAKLLSTKLLTFSRMGRLDVKILNAKKLIDDILPVLDGTFDKKIEIRTKISKDLFLEVDKNQMHQSLINVCNNARDAMIDGGVLTIECSRRVPDETAQGLVPSADEPDVRECCTIKISDTGVGIPEENVEKIFEPFFTTKNAGEGTGLGLSTTHGIIKGHDGSIRVESKPGVGTTISIHLPLVAGDVENTREDRLEGHGCAESEGTILVVDDEQSVLDLMHDALTGTGYNVLTCSASREASKGFKENRNVIELVILDVMMPDMDGREVYEEIRSIDEDVKVLFSSGYNSHERISELLKLDNVEYIQKPFSINELINKVNKSMR